MRGYTRVYFKEDGMLGVDYIWSLYCPAYLFRALDKKDNRGEFLYECYREDNTDPDLGFRE